MSGCETVKKFDTSKSFSPRTILCGKTAKTYRIPKQLHEINVCDECFNRHPELYEDAVIVK